MFSYLSRFILWSLGWKITGRYPYEQTHVLIAVAPHTSTWDFPLGILVRSAKRIKANFMGKDSLFKPPFGWLFRWLGGIPVDRSKSHNMVSGTVDAFMREPHVHLVIAPEGTRKKVDKFKTGFYHISRLSGAPICLCKFDFEHKEVFFDPNLFYPTDDEQADMAFLWNYFKGVKGGQPEKGVL